MDVSDLFVVRVHYQCVYYRRLCVYIGITPVHNKIHKMYLIESITIDEVLFHITYKRHDIVPGSRVRTEVRLTFLLEEGTCHGESVHGYRTRRDGISERFRRL